MAKILTKDLIYAAPDIQREEVEIPEWNGSVFIKTMTAHEKDTFESMCTNAQGVQDMTNARAIIAVMSVVDEDGNRIFELGDVDELNKKSGRAIDRIFTVACRLSGLRREDMEKAVGNSSGQGGASLSV